MAGVKGRSGGARPGAGRKPQPKAPPPPPVVVEVPPEVEQQRPDASEPKDMLEYLQDVALGRIATTPLQLRAAIAAVQYTHTKRHDGGKKEERADAAKKAAGGRFAPKAPPKLVVSNG